MSSYAPDVAELAGTAMTRVARDAAFQRRLSGAVVIGS
jgi:hypothetical protein